MQQARSFLDVYRHCIRPRLSAIDLFLRLNEPPYPAEQVASVLALSPHDVLHVRSSGSVDRAAFMQILASGESYICRLYRRELERGAPVVYTPEDVAYIYGLMPSKVREACAALGIREATALRLPDIFAAIPLCKASFDSITYTSKNGKSNSD